MKKLFSQKRIGRLEYIIYIYAPLFLLTLTGAMTEILTSKFQVPLSVIISEGYVSYVAIFVWFLLFIVLSIKRLHDMNLSGLYVLIPIAIIFLISIVTFGFGAIPALIMSTLFMGIKKGSSGPNNFG